MRLGTVRRDAGTQAFRQNGGTTTYFDIPDAGALLERSDWSSLIGEQGPEPLPEELAPPVPRPGKFVCAGLNYFDHAREVGKDAPAYPTLFAKTPNALLGPRDDIQLPEREQSSRVDWEAELVIVIGMTVRNADADTAAKAIVGYTALNDVSVRDWQKRTEEWFQGKNFDATSPVGPFIVTADEIDPAAGLSVQCLVNGYLMQSGRTDDMIFSCRELVAYISQFMTLEPGDLIATGTPAGVGAGRTPQQFLKPGDELVTRIEGIGELRNVCR